MNSQTFNIAVDDLPYWMRQAQRGWDWGLVLAAVFSVLAAWPFIYSPDLPRTNAAENYIFMTANYSDALREGRLYPRWSPNTFNGYGAPIPNFFPPGTPYTAALIKVLFTNDPVLAVRVVFIMAHLVAGTALYAFVRRWSTANAGLLAAVLFLYSPYFGNVAPFIRSDLAEYAALALVPLLLLVIDRLTSDNRPLDLLWSVLVTAALLVTHPWVALVGMFIALFHSLPRRWFQTVVSMILGAGLSAFFLVPALLERHMVQWIDRTTVQTLSLRGLFAPFQPVDLGQLLPDAQLTLGSTLILFSFLAATALLITRSNPRFYLRFLLLGIVLAAVSLTGLPEETWPPQPYCPVSVCSRQRHHGATDAVASGCPAPFSRRHPDSRPDTLTARPARPPLARSLWWGARHRPIRYEQQGAGIAALPPYWSIPVTATADLLPNRFLLSGYQSGNINKIAPGETTSRTQISLLEHQTHRDRYQVISDFAVDLDLLTTYFPGWQATLAGQTVNVRPDEQTGLIKIQIPPTNSELVVTFGPTSTRRVAWLLTWGTLGIVLVITRWRLVRATEPPPETDLLTTAETRLLSIVLVAFALIATLLTNPASPITLYDRPGHALSEAISLHSRTSVGLETLAYRLESSRLHAGADLNFTIYWQAIRALPANYQTRAYLIEDGSGTRWHRTPLQTPGAYPTNRWQTYQYVSDHFTIPLSTTIIPGQYQIAIEVLDCDLACNDSKRLSFFNPDGAAIGPTLILPSSIQVVP